MRRVIKEIKIFYENHVSENQSFDNISFEFESSESEFNYKECIDLYEKKTNNFIGKIAFTSGVIITAVKIIELWNFKYFRCAHCFSPFQKIQQLYQDCHILR